MLNSFSIIGSNIISVDLFIYNRWGELIFQQSGKQPCWNGKIGEMPVPEGVYYYFAYVKGISELKSMQGYITVLH
jgi:gliding motility-associated-like protein